MLLFQYEKGELIVKKFSTSAESEECCVTVLQEMMQKLL
jgi:hypothetical protein